MYRDTLLSAGSLFHYTPTKDNLKSIIKSGLRANFSLEEISFSFADELFQEEAELMGPATMRKWFEAKNNRQNADQIYLAMISFCDIPLELSKPHRDIYGNYAIGLSKEWAENVIGLNPIIYMTKSSKLLSYFSTLYTRISLIDQNYFFRAGDEPSFLGADHPYEREMKEKEFKNVRFQAQNYDKVLKMCREIVCYVKPYSGCFLHGSYENQHHRFYDEREWRYIPQSKQDSPNCLSRSMYNTKELKAFYVNNVQSLELDLSSITHIVVNSQDEVDDITEYIYETQTLLSKKIDLSTLKVVTVE